MDEYAGRVHLWKILKSIKESKINDFVVLLRSAVQLADENDVTILHWSEKLLFESHLNK